MEMLLRNCTLSEENDYYSYHQDYTYLKKIRSPLTVNNTGSACLQTTTLSVNVTSAPCFANSNFTAIPTSTAQYWNVVSSYPWNVINASWDWGNGSNSNTLYASHTYSAAAVYSLCLAVTVSCGGISTTCNSYFIKRGTENMTMIYVSVIPPQTVAAGINEQNAGQTTLSFYPNPSKRRIYSEHYRRNTS